MIVLCGKTCTGKDTVKKELIKLGYNSIVTYTTRPPRKNEVDGITYHFINDSDFLVKELEDFFVETTNYTTEYGVWSYGSAIEDLERATDNDVIIMNPEGIRKIRNLSSLNPIVFYINTSEKVLEERLSIRGDNPKESKRRLKADNEDFLGIDELIDYQISGTETPENLAKLIRFLVETRHKE